MPVTCKDIANFIEEFAPVCLAEDWDNVGLMVGSLDREIKRMVVCLDVTSDVVDRAIKDQADLIVSHHPLIFKPLKKINEDDFKGRIIARLIRSNITVYSAHTNLDVGDNGINEYLASKLGLIDVANLNKYKSEDLFKIVVFVPEENLDDVRNAMCSAGAGWIGNYSDCTFSVKGTGTFRPLEGTNPYIGSLGKLERVNEIRIETVIPAAGVKSVLNAIFSAHPYEEVAYDIYKLELNAKEYGLGKVGILEEPLSLEDFINYLKKKLEIGTVRLIGSTDKAIKKVAVFCGGFDGNWSGILAQGVDILVTGDLKYNNSLDAVEMGMCIIDAGHFYTERIIVPQLAALISKRFPQIKVWGDNLEKDPFKYC